MSEWRAQQDGREREEWVSGRVKEVVVSEWRRVDKAVVW